MCASLRLCLNIGRFRHGGGLLIGPHSLVGLCIHVTSVVRRFKLVWMSNWRIFLRGNRPHWIHVSYIPCRQCKCHGIFDVFSWRDDLHCSQCRPGWYSVGGLVLLLHRNRGRRLYSQSRERSENVSCWCRSQKICCINRTACTSTIKLFVTEVPEHQQTTNPCSFIYLIQLIIFAKVRM